VERHLQTILIGAGTLMGTAMLGLLSWLVWTSYDNGKLLASQATAISYQAKQLEMIGNDVTLVQSEISGLIRDLNYATDVRTDVDRLGKSLEVIQQRLINLERNGQ